MNQMSKATFAFILATSTLAGNVAFAKELDKEQTLQKSDYQVIESNETLYRDFLITLLSPNMQEAVNEFYKNQSKARSFGLYDAKILNIKRLDKGSYYFEITVQVKTYTGAHNPPYGIETITLTNFPTTQIRVIKFTHQDA